MEVSCLLLQKQNKIIFLREREVGYFTSILQEDLCFEKIYFSVWDQFLKKEEKEKIFSYSTLMYLLSEVFTHTYKLTSFCQKKMLKILKLSSGKKIDTVNWHLSASFLCF